jgi:hypothetical protein
MITDKHILTVLKNAQRKPARPLSCSGRSCVNRSCVGRSCVNRSCSGRSCVDRVCVDRVCVDRVCVGRSLSDTHIHEKSQLLGQVFSVVSANSLLYKELTALKIFVYL